MSASLYMRVINHIRCYPYRNRAIITRNERYGSTISFKSPSRSGECSGELHGETGKGRAGLVVLHEWWGLNQQIRETSTHLAERGNFVTLTPDLFKGQVADDMDKAVELMTTLDWEGAVRDSEGAADHLRSQGCKHVGVVGYSMGGALALATASLSDRFSAAATFYGIPVFTFADPSNIKISVQCHFGELDRIQGFSSPRDAEQLRKKLRSGQVPHEFHMYFAAHGFANPSSENFQQDIRDKATQRLIDFMNAHLK